MKREKKMRNSIFSEITKRKSFTAEMLMEAGASVNELIPFLGEKSREELFSFGKKLKQKEGVFWEAVFKSFWARPVDFESLGYFLRLQKYHWKPIPFDLYNFDSSFWEDSRLQTLIEKVLDLSIGSSKQVQKDVVQDILKVLSFANASNEVISDEQNKELAHSIEYKLDRFISKKIGPLLKKQERENLLSWGDKFVLYHTKGIIIEFLSCKLDKLLDFELVILARIEHSHNEKKKMVRDKEERHQFLIDSYHS